MADGPSRLSRAMHGPLDPLERRAARLDRCDQAREHDDGARGQGCIKGGTQLTSSVVEALRFGSPAERTVCFCMFFFFQVSVLCSGPIARLGFGRSSWCSIFSP